jgi:hypothetical protein
MHFARCKDSADLRVPPHHGASLVCVISDPCLVVNLILNVALLVLLVQKHRQLFHHVVEREFGNWPLASPEHIAEARFVVVVVDVDQASLDKAFPHVLFRCSSLQQCRQRRRETGRVCRMRGSLFSLPSATTFSTFRKSWSS